MLWVPSLESAYFCQTGSPGIFFSQGLIPTTLPTLSPATAHTPFSTCLSFRKPSLHLLLIYTLLSWPWVVISNLEKLHVRDWLRHAVLPKRNLALFLHLCISFRDSSHFSSWSSILGFLGLCWIIHNVIHCLSQVLIPAPPCLWLYFIFRAMSLLSCGRER